MLVQVTRDVRDFGVELVPGEGLTYHTRENLDTYFWYAWDTSHASDAKKPCFSYPRTTYPRIIYPRTNYPRTTNPRIKDPVHGLKFCQKIPTSLYVNHSKIAKPVSAQLFHRKV